MWISSRTLRRLKGTVRFVDALSTFAAGSLGLLAVRLFLNIGPAVIEESWAPYVLVGLIATVTTTVITKVAEIFWLDSFTRDAEIITSAMRYLYDRLFGRDSGHRITFLAQRFPSSSYIRPRYRYAYGTGERLRSKARFRRGTAIAGMSWDTPGGGEEKVLLREIPDFGGDDPGFIAFMTTELRLSQEEANHLSNVTRQARWILTYGIVDPLSGDFVGVISIDSRYEDALERVNFLEILTVSAIIGSAVRS